MNRAHHIRHINMGPLAYFVWILAVLFLTDIAPATSAHREEHYGSQPQPRLIVPDFAANEMPTGAVVDDVAGGPGGDGPVKVLRYSLKETPINGTALERQRRMTPRDIASSERRGSVLDKRAKWNWKHLEDYRGYLYFIESTFQVSRSAKEQYRARERVAMERN